MRAHYPSERVAIGNANRCKLQLRSPADDLVGMGSSA
jgi:hypothetical protein